MANIQTDYQAALEKLATMKGKPFADLIDKEAAVQFKMDAQRRLDYVGLYVSGKYDEPLYSRVDATPAATGSSRSTNKNAAQAAKQTVTARKPDPLLKSESKPAQLHIPAPRKVELVKNL